MTITAFGVPSWLASAAIGFWFTSIGVPKVFRLTRGIVDDREKTLSYDTVGHLSDLGGPKWEWRILRIGVPFLFLGIGPWILATFARQIYATSHSN